MSAPPPRSPHELNHATPALTDPGSAVRFELPDEAATRSLGAALGHAILTQSDTVQATGALVTLSGELGAGKTALVRAMLRHLGIKGAIRSPTFTLLEPYAISSLDFYHLDLYRFGQQAQAAEEFADAGFRELFGPRRVVLVEWPERVTGMLPRTDLAIALSYRPSLAPLVGEPSIEFVDDTPRHALIHALSAQGRAWLILISKMAQTLAQTSADPLSPDAGS